MTYSRLDYFNDILNRFSDLKGDHNRKEKLRDLFKKVEPVIVMHTCAINHSFLSYNFICYKLCQHLAYDDLLENISLFKNADKLRHHETIWKKVCENLELNFLA